MQGVTVTKRLIRSLGAIVLALTILVSTASALSVERALELLEESYLRDIPAEAYEAEKLEELFEILGDPYTYYMSAEEYQAFLDSVENTVDLVGIGVSIQYTQQGIYVVEALKGGSAYEAGIQSGDLIVAVNGVSCVPADESHRAMILGEEGTKVTITVLRDSVTTDYVLTRSLVVIPNTEFEVLDGAVGYIACSSFGSDTGVLFQEGVQANDETVDRWVVDLRNNSGGYTNSAVDAVGVFAGAGIYLYLQDAAGGLYYYAYLQEASAEKPLVVLVNGNTASAAEAFSAGVRDLELGITVGSRTYGKGVAQVVFDQSTHPDYFDGDAVKLTAYRFYSAGGITNDLVGVIPTLLVEDEETYDVALAVSGTDSSGKTDQMVVELDGQLLWVELSSVEENTLVALFEALPPTAAVWLCTESGELDSFSVTEGAQLLDVVYDSRWFDDVADSEYADAINTLATYNLVHGDGKGSFYPQKALTRAQACALVAKMLGIVSQGRQYFTDVLEDSAYAPYINAMAELGFVEGVGNGLFQPDRQMTQQEFYMLISRVARYLSVNFDYAAELLTQEQLDAEAELGFSGWACAGAALLDSMDALCGTPEPKTPILREEAAASLYAVLIAAGVLPE